MTTITETRPFTADAPHSTPAARVWRVVRLQLTNKWNTIALPWVVLGAVFLMNYAIWLLIAQSASANDKSDALEGTQWSGSTFFIFIYMMVVAIQAINVTFSFALGFSVTRRDYYLGTALTWIILSAALSIGFALLTYIEQWTGGWGLGGHFFTAIYFDNQNPLLRVFTLFAMFLFFFFVGTASATIYVRWKINGMLVAGAVTAILLIGAMALIGLTHSWGAVGDWFATVGPAGVVAWSLVITVIAAVAGFFILRRATPKS
ncbi:hypothetical protein [Leifsonia sp. Root112D2]|uniref:hypothetical protein n=1 Tax=Leifsonia sp. Root112D2 TaxID=1736426 RepID=UPI000A65276A|nr:hypothetical protein [Leifsonia sp. Root112D2]